MMELERLDSENRKAWERLSTARLTLQGLRTAHCCKTSSLQRPTPLCMSLPGRGRNMPYTRGIYGCFVLTTVLKLRSSEASKTKRGKRFLSLSHRPPMGLCNQGSRVTSRERQCKGRLKGLTFQIISRKSASVQQKTAIFSFSASYLNNGFKDSPPALLGRAGGESLNPLF